MQYEPIKRSLGRFISGSVIMRKAFYYLLNLILLRAWHIKKALKKIESDHSGEAVVLDAGAGFGQYTWWMSRLNRKWKINAVDIDKDQTDACSAFINKTGNSDRISFRTADLTTFTEPMYYDLILSVDVMEHIKEDETVFRNFYNSLKDNGILLISTPSDKGGSDIHDEDNKSFIDEHVRSGYGIDEITAKLNNAGFRTVEASYTYGKPGKISWMLTMKYPVKMLNVSYLFFVILPFYFLVFFPVSIILNIFDLCLDHKTGTGLLVRATKVT
ncbi:MAG: methyltransferase domain-containing protein [Bacteroidales bacterium]|nr:methyltransferase domain-containing protein [Bacteroidales bacterium]